MDEVTTVQQLASSRRTSLNKILSLLLYLWFKFQSETYFVGSFNIIYLFYYCKHISLNS